MIKKRLVDLLSHAKKYIVYQVAWLWIALLCQIVMIYCAAFLLEQALFWEVTPRMAVSYGGGPAVWLILGFFCGRRGSPPAFRGGGGVENTPHPPL